MHLPPSTVSLPDEQPSSQVTWFTNGSDLAKIVAEHFYTLPRGTIHTIKCVTPSAYETFLDKLPTTYGEVFDKLRYDWDAAKGELTLRMPTAIHEVFVTQITMLLDQKVEHAVSKYQDLAEKYMPAGSTDLTDDMGNKRSPDGSWYFDDNHNPSFILEVAHSQQSEDARAKAEKTHAGSEGQTKTIVAFDIEYWNPEGCNRRSDTNEARACDYTIYRGASSRDDDGTTYSLDDSVTGTINPDPGDETPALVMTVADFTPQESRTPMPADQIVLTHGEIQSVLNRAERIQKKLDAAAAKRLEDKRGFAHRCT